MKKILTLIFFLLATFALFGQDADFDFDFGEAAGDATSGGSGGSLPPGLSFNGEGGLNMRAYIDTVRGYDSFFAIGDNTTMYFSPYFKFGINYDAGVADIDAKLKFDPYTLGLSECTGPSALWGILDELTVRAFLGDWVLEAGKMKIVWGKGDKVHVLDNFNANDYTDFVIPDYLDRRIAEPMLHVVYNAPIRENLRIEAVWTPIMTPNRYDKSEWLPYKVHQIEKNVKGIFQEKVTQSFNAHTTHPYDPTLAPTDAQNAQALGYAAQYLTALNAANDFSEDDLYEETGTWKYGQFGARITWTAGPVDLGVSYYYGHYKDVTADWSGGIPTLGYDTLHVFGVEAGAVAGPLNLRFEVAYNMTNDFSGDDPFVKNHSISWLGGFDFDIPKTNLTFNIQNVGTALLNIDGIDEKFDADFDSDSFYTHNKLVIQLADSELHDKLKWELNAIVGLENGEVAILPKLEYNIVAGLFVHASGGYLFNQDCDGEFWNFVASDDNNSKGYTTHDKGWVELGMKYVF